MGWSTGSAERDAGVADPRLAPLRELMTSYARGGRVGSVSVVGNAPMEPSAERAAAIDGADLVLRTNSFTLDDAASATVGRRADVVLFARTAVPTPTFFAGYRSRLYVLLEPMRMFHRREEWPTSWPADLGLTVARNDAVAVPLLSELGVRWRRNRLAPTTGTTAVWLARALFPDVRPLVTGFSYLETAPEEWGYHSGASGVIGREHRIEAEGALLRRWRAEGRLRFWPTDASPPDPEER